MCSSEDNNRPDDSYTVYKIDECANEEDIQIPAEALFQIGCLLADDKDNSQNIASAAGFFQNAAEQGLAEAQYNLGVCYINGWGVPQDVEEAIKWLRKAAEQGYEDAIDALKALEVD